MEKMILKHGTELRMIKHNSYKQKFSLLMQQFRKLVIYKHLKLTKVLRSSMFSLVLPLSSWFSIALHVSRVRNRAKVMANKKSMMMISESPWQMIDWTLSKTIPGNNCLNKNKHNFRKHNIDERQMPLLPQSRRECSRPSRPCKLK